MVVQRFMSGSSGWVGLVDLLTLPLRPVCWSKARPSCRPSAGIWKRAKAAAGEWVAADLHFHDLRHIGKHFAAASGASTWELMGRGSHASMRAALIDQHRTVERDRVIAEALDATLRVSE